jgi:hypothetical protein
MADSFLRRFANVATLKEISQEHLLLFFNPFEDYLAGRGYRIPSNPTEGIDYEALVAILLNPTRDMPPHLAQRLYLVHEMATDHGMQELLNAVHPGLLSFGGPDPTPADVALQVLLKDRELLERKHAEQFLVRTKSFYVCQGSGVPRDDLPDCPAEIMQAIELEFDDWFEENRRGRGSKVFVFPRRDDGEVWFLVRHGLAMRRQGSLDNGESSSIFFRPEVFDVVVYHQVQDALIVHISPYVKSIRELYRKVLGRRIFGHEDYFAADGNYTLLPLQAKRSGALDFSGIKGIEDVTLHEIEIFVSKGRGVFFDLRGDDVFCYLDESKMDLPKGFWSKAVFWIEFSDAKTPRAVTIRPPSRTNFARDDDRSLVERFLAQNGFVLNAKEEASEEAEAPVGRA